MSNFNYGYEYQDLVAINLALTLLTKRKQFKMILDYKEHEKDRLDDIIIEIDDKKYKMQVKHNKTKENLEKKHFEDTTGIFNIKNALFNQSDNIIPVFITNRKYEGDFLLQDDNVSILFDKIFRINDTDSSSKKIIVVPNYFNASFNNDELGELEIEAEKKLKYLGIGLYPNENINFKLAITNLIVEFNRLRINNDKYLSTITNEKILNIIGLITTHKELPQSFKIEKEYNVVNMDLYAEVFKNLDNNICIVGEPGIGKSWFVQNIIENYFEPKNIKVVRYTFFRNIQDISIKDRINKNVMIANIKKQLINYFGYKMMSNLYSSSLHEILEFLEKNNETITFIFDGLDHIDREYLLHSNGLLKEFTEVNNEIIEISKSRCNVIIVSQPIDDLNYYLENGFKKIVMPRFTYLETLDLINKMELTIDCEYIKKIQHTANGNPLYIRTILNNIKCSGDFEFLDIISDDINSYYDYLLTNIDIDKNIIPLLINGYMTLSATEMNEITGYSLPIIQAEINNYLSVLKMNVIDDSYTIYHESLRRFILDKINQSGSNIKTLCYKRIAEWLMEKDNIFETKIYNTYFNILFEAEKFKEIVSKCNYDFVYQSYFNGYFSQVDNIIDLIAKSLNQLNPSINEIVEFNLVKNLIYHSKENIEYEYDSISQYYAKKYSYEKIHSILYGMDDEPLLNVEMGLSLLYHCDNNNISVNWKPYILKYRQESKNDTRDVTRYLMRFYIISGNIEKYLNQVKPNPIADKIGKSLFTIIKEEIGYKNYSLVDAEIEDKEYLEMFLNYGNTYQTIDPKIIYEKNFFNNHIGEKIYSLKYANIDEIENFERKIPKFTDSYVHNWYKLICRVYKTMKTSGTIDDKIIDWMKSFLNDSYIFSRLGRMVDASGLYDAMASSIKDIFEYINDETVLKNVLSLFFEKASDTTGIVIGAKMGPFTENNILDILNSIKNDHNQALLFNTAFDFYSTKNISGSYVDIASVYLKIACLGYSYINDDQAIELYKKAMILLMSYFHHKETSIYDLTNTLNFIKDDINLLISLYDFLVEIKRRTDGKDIHGSMEEYLDFLNENYPLQYTLFYFNQLDQLEYDDRDFLEDRQYYLRKIAESKLLESCQLIKFLIRMSFNFDYDVNETDIKYFINAYTYLLNLKQNSLAKELKKNFESYLSNHKRIEIFDDSIFETAIKIFGNDKIEKYQITSDSKEKIIKESYALPIKNLLIHYENNDPLPSEYKQIEEFLNSDNTNSKDADKLIDLIMDKLFLDWYILRNNKEQVKRIIFLINKYDFEKYLNYLVKLFVYLQDGWGLLCSDDSLLEEILKYDKKKIEKLFLTHLMQAMANEKYPVMKQASRIIECFDKINADNTAACINLLYCYIKQRLPFSVEMENIRAIFKGTDIKARLMQILKYTDYPVSLKMKLITLKEMKHAGILKK